MELLPQGRLLAPTATLPSKPRGDGLKNTVAGAAGGIMSVLMGQPLDLIRVRLQTSTSGNALKTVKDIFKNEGALAFYKGAMLPFMGVGAAVSIQFYTYHSVRKALSSFNNSSHTESNYHPLILQSYLAGGAAGFANSIISGPVEQIRTRLQLQPVGVQRLYTGPFDCIRQIVGTVGVKGLFRGHMTVIAREFQAYGCYFGAFEASMQSIASFRQIRREDLTTWTIAPCGALAGIAFWVGSYPLDVVKTKVQSDGFGPNRRYKNAWAAAVETWQVSRYMGFFRGLGPALIRTMLSSSATFAVAEKIRNVMS